MFPWDVPDMFLVYAELDNIERILRKYFRDIVSPMERSRCIINPLKSGKIAYD